MSRKNILRIAAATMAITAVISVIALAGLFFRGRKAGFGSGTGSGGKTVEEMLGLEDEAAPVYYNGKEYRLNPDLESYLLVGVDQNREPDPVTMSEYGVHADVLLLMVLDRTRERVTVLQVNRDTIVEMDEIDADGTFVKTRRLPVQYAYFFGEGSKASCENTVKAVSGLLYGMEIDGYAVLKMDAVPVLNDLVGGVPVTIEDDFSQADPTLAMGETVTLYGQHAMNFIRSRKNVGNGQNTSRMRRHRAYFNAFAAKAEALMEENIEIAARLCQAAMPYMQTDMGSGTVVSLLEEASGYENAGIVTLEGRNEVEEKHNTMRHFADDASVRETVMELFYLETDMETGG